MSQINFSRVRSLTARQITAALERDGFEWIGGPSSYRQYRHPDGRRVTVSYKGSGATFNLRSLRSMLQRQARWTMDDLRRLRLL